MSIYQFNYSVAKPRKERCTCTWGAPWVIHRRCLSVLAEWLYHQLLIGNCLESHTAWMNELLNESLWSVLSLTTIHVSHRMFSSWRLKLSEQECILPLHTQLLFPSRYADRLFRFCVASSRVWGQLPRCCICSIVVLITSRVLCSLQSPT